MKKTNLVIKRIVDVFGSLFGSLLLSPLLILIALSIKMESSGPIFFQQERLGFEGKKFKIIKFRSMVDNAENIGDGLRIKSKRDSRITKTGKFLRKTSLDELPQLFNVLRGEMSLVGPRPPVTYHPYNGYSKYPKWAKKRFQMKPGVTGLAQVKFRNSVPWDARIKYDNKYIDNFSFIYDCKILFKTVKEIIKPTNLYLEDE